MLVSNPRVRVSNGSLMHSRDVQPVEGFTHQQEGAGVPRPPVEKGSADGWLGSTALASSITGVGVAIRVAARSGTGRTARDGAIGVASAVAVGNSRGETVERSGGRAVAAADSRGRPFTMSTAGWAGTGGWVGPATWFRPYFLRNLYKAMREMVLAKGLRDELDPFGLAGLGMADEESSDGTGVAWQEFAVGAAVHAVVSLPNGGFGRHPLLFGGRGASDTDQTRDLCDFEAAFTVEEEMTEQSRRVIVVALLLAEAEDRLQQDFQLGRSTLRGNVSLFKPGNVVFRRDCHGILSRASDRGIVYSVVEES